MLSLPTTIKQLFEFLQEGIRYDDLCIPMCVHGIQDYDLEFARIFGDDSAHIPGPKNFPRFKILA